MRVGTAARSNVRSVPNAIQRTLFHLKSKTRQDRLIRLTTSNELNMNELNVLQIRHHYNELYFRNANLLVVK